MQNSNIECEYLSIDKISQLTGIKIDTIQKRVQRKKYSVRQVASVGGKRGTRYEILVSSLEEELQEKILLHIYSICNYLGADDKSGLQINQAPISLKMEASNDRVIPEKAKRLALYKFDTVSCWLDFKNNNKIKKNADNDFVNAFNNGLISQKLLNVIGKISIRTLKRWKKKLKDNCNDYHALINNYSYSGTLSLNTSLTDIEKQEFIKLYYNDAKLDISVAYQLLKIKLQNQNINIKSLATYRRFVNFIHRNHYDFDVLARKGEKALKDYVAPYHRRDISDINAGDVFVADGNQLDFMVINPYTGKPARAIWLVFFDWFSFDVAGYQLMLTENTQNISCALRNSIIRLGRIPKKVYMDNGRAFRGKYFKGCDDFNKCGILGVYKSLGIKEVVAKPYNGRSKIVERFFKDFTKSCPPLIGSYVGNNISNKPAHLSRNEKFHKELHKDDKIPTIEQAKLIIEAWLNNFHRKKVCPHDKTKTIGEVFLSGRGNGVDIDMLDELMMATEIRTIKRNTVRLFGLEYESSALYGKNGKFLIKYSLLDISHIKIYSLKGEYICDASTVTPIKAFVQDGTITDLYNYKMQQKQHNELLKRTIKNTRALIGNSNPFSGIFEIENQQDVAKIDKKQNKPKLEITCFENVTVPQKKELII